jgi:hypothetical protein
MSLELVRFSASKNVGDPWHSATFGGYGSKATTTRAVWTGEHDGESCHTARRGVKWAFGFGRAGRVRASVLAIGLAKNLRPEAQSLAFSAPEA